MSLWWTPQCICNWKQACRNGIALRKIREKKILKVLLSVVFSEVIRWRTFFDGAMLMFIRVELLDRGDFFEASGLFGVWLGIIGYFAEWSIVIDIGFEALHALRERIRTGVWRGGRDYIIEVIEGNGFVVFVGVHE